MTMQRILATLLILALPVAAGAQTVDLVFEPPDIETGKVCETRPSDDALIKKWEGVSLDALPESDTALIKRDFRRLVELDPQRWFDTIEMVQSNFRSIDPQYSEANMLIDRIELLLAALERTPEPGHLVVVLGACQGGPHGGQTCEDLCHT